MTIESQYLNVIYCKLTKAGTGTSVSALVLGALDSARDRVRFSCGEARRRKKCRPSGVVGAFGRT